MKKYIRMHIHHMYTLTVLGRGCRKIYVYMGKQEKRAKVSAVTPMCLRLTVCVGPPGWHRSECAGR